MTLEDVGIATSRIDRVLRLVIRPAIYGERLALTVVAHHVGGEPISVADARGRVYEPFEVGRPWGGAWDTTWFRMSATIPAEWAGSEVTALLDLGGTGIVGFTAEGLVWEGDQPRQGLHLKHREYVVARPAVGGDPVELLIEAAANPIPPWETSPWPLLMPDVGGRPIYSLGQAELAVVNREIEAFFFDALVLRKLLDVLPAESARAAEVLAALEHATATIVPDDVAGSAARRARCWRRRGNGRPRPARTA